MKSKKKHRNKGFTLLELLVVISLIGILTTLIVSNLTAARERSRDAQRKSNINSLQTALRLYYNDFGKFPASSSNLEIQGCGAGTDTCSWGGSWSTDDNTYMSTLPKDPISTYSYRYTQIDLDNYTLASCLENKSDVNGVPTADTTWCPSAVKYEVTP